MKHSSRLLLTYALLVAYSSVVLLGQGMHLLSVGHGSHVGDHVVECLEHHSHAEHDFARHEHGGPVASADQASHSSELAIQSNACNNQSHACAVCQFLGQARSVPPAIVLATSNDHVADFVPLRAESAFLPIAFGPHAPRGPPVVRLVSLA
jgi:hypothetical protein